MPFVKTFFIILSKNQFVFSGVKPPLKSEISKHKKASKNQLNLIYSEVNAVVFTVGTLF